MKQGQTSIKINLKMKEIRTKRVDTVKVPISYNEKNRKYWVPPLRTC